MAFDVDMIERIILNLLSNAVKFTSPGGNISVNINDEDKYVNITVRDSGIGIPEDKLSIIFDRFRQVDKSLTRNTEGSGIGLNLVKSLVKLHGGEINAYSIEGTGSQFVVKLPVTLTEEDEAAATIDIPQEKVERVNIEFSDIYS
jgi:signal transduction histidine kinase